MDHEKAVIGFIGAGGIASSHAYSLNALRYFYDDPPEIETAAVCSASPLSRDSFAARFGFGRSCDLDTFIAGNDINTVFILGPNNFHYEHLKAACGMKSVRRIYLEKPVCGAPGEVEAIAGLPLKYPWIKIQVGFQYVFAPSVREALFFWKTGILGRPLHFDIKYYHGDYITKDYRDRRASRLTPAPEGGAMADLGSHALSMLMAFLGHELNITGALQSGSFDDVSPASDLFSLITLHDRGSDSVGTLSSSRISAGTRDSLILELFAENGALRYSSDNADFFEYYTTETGVWNRQYVGSSYRSVTNFPSGHVPAGWLRAMVHAHYVFLTGSGNEPFIPDLPHGLEVQRIVNQAAKHLSLFREAKNIS